VLAQETIESGVNRPLTINLPDKYWDILFTMSHLQGRTVEDLALERLKQIIIEDIRMGLFDGGMYGTLLSESWEESLKGDQYYEGT
jgi:hypothetical protein